MEFLFGIEKEAEIFCTSVKIGMKSQQDVVNKFIDMAVPKLQRMDIEHKNHTDVVNLICNMAQEDIQQIGWNLNSEEDVSWVIALYSKSYVRSLKHSICDFDKIFTDCFKVFFSKL